MVILTLILASLYYFLPAYFANMSPNLLKKINPLKTPVDFNKKFRGKLIFGHHKTWGGLIIASLIGVLTFYLQTLLYQYSFFQKYSLINYTEYSLWLGFLLGFGAIFGDLIKSFFKRRYNRKPGQPWVPFDQLDFVIGAFLFSFILYIPPAFTIVVVIIASPILHIITNRLGYYLKINKSKW
jgi:CDP-2,3-bis-(O-geranylgeranyl)-sn-glycerol synthase